MKNKDLTKFGYINTRQILKIRSPLYIKSSNRASIQIHNSPSDFAHIIISSWTVCKQAALWPWSLWPARSHIHHWSKDSWEMKSTALLPAWIAPARHAPIVYFSPGEPRERWRWFSIFAWVIESAVSQLMLRFCPLLSSMTWNIMPAVSLLMNRGGRIQRERER